jgi:hypothetical protein
MPAMIPVYFQTSRWLRGYLQKPAYADGYKSAAVDSYVDTVKAALAPPPQQLVRKLGVSGTPDHDPGKSFDYIQTGWVTGQQELLQRSCGYPGQGASQAGKNNGLTSYATWRHAFQQLFASDGSIGPGAGRPLFGMIDTNSAHHLSAPLVERAIRFGDPQRLNGQPQRAMVVVNFDAHTDYGAKAAAAEINCQTWGRFVSNSIPQLHPPLADAYVRLGRVTGKADPTWANGEWHRADTDQPPVSIEFDQSSNDPIGAQLDTVIQAIANGRPVDAYVSLDRDLLQQSYTQYLDGPFPENQGIAGVIQCATHLANRGARLVGFDITGLPTYPGDVRDKQLQLSIPEAIDLATSHIARLWNAISALP